MIEWVVRGAFIGSVVGMIIMLALEMYHGMLISLVSAFMSLDEDGQETLKKMLILGGTVSIEGIISGFIMGVVIGALGGDVHSALIGAIVGAFALVFGMYFSRGLKADRVDIRGFAIKSALAGAPLGALVGLLADYVYQAF